MYRATDFAASNQVAIVTGAGDGIGRAIAQTLASAGAAVMLAITSMASENKNRNMASHGSSNVVAYSDQAIG